MMKEPSLMIIDISPLRKLGLTLLVCCIINADAPAQTCIVFGTYSSVPAVSYTCGSGLITFNYSEWTFTNQGSGVIHVAGSPAGSPPVMTGAINCNDSTFAFNAVVPGSCTETYSLDGRFTSDTSWIGTFRAMYQGSGCGLANCVNQTFQVSGSTNHVTSVSATSVPLIASLEQNFPNPFNPSTTIQFSLAHPAFVSLKIFNQLGEETAALVNEELGAGTHNAALDAVGIASGVYFYRLEVIAADYTGSFTSVKKLVLMK